ncbi:pentamidine resistance protein 1 [Novymonas esmeraldas]|uniref:Pentamidine resistance protein 1 n=1 Tax=Novymonas esmeraldas TaxID=1808958 RepID=A0AAW0EZC6_9TRYP
MAARETVYSFAEVNRRLWRLPTCGGAGGDGGDVDWAVVRGGLEEAPEEQSSAVVRYLLSWLDPYITLAWRERLEEAYMPPPQRAHRAVCCGALLDCAFREEEMRSGRDAWRAHVEVAVATGAAPVGAAAAGGGVGGARVAAPNALARVGFRGEEGVRGRLRWVGYVRSSNTPHALVGGVEWDAGSALPLYRTRLADDAAHDGCVHGERLFHQVQPGQPRCTCEYVHDLVPLLESGAAAPAGSLAAPHAPSLMWAMLRTFKSDLWAMLPPTVVSVMCEVSTPWLLQRFVLFLQSNKEKDGVRKGLLYFLLFVVVKLLQPVMTNKQMHRARRVSSLFRTSALALVFEKCLTVSPDALSRPDMNTGRVLTMASSDMESIKNFPIQVMFLWMAPAMLVFYIAYIFSLVGWSALAGLLVVLVSLPVQGWVTALMGSTQESLSGCTDQRLRRTNELLSGIRVVKTMGWESKFLSAIEDDARAEELHYRRRMQLCHVGLWGVVFSTPSFMVAAVLTTFTLTGQALDASIVLPVIAIISAVTFPMMVLPEAFAALAQFIVSTDRITRFLECEDSHIIVEHAERVFGSGGASTAEAAEAAEAAALDGATVLASVPAALPVYEPRHRGLRAVVERVLCVVLRRRVPVELQWRRADGTTAVPAAGLPSSGGGTGTAAASVAADGGDGGDGEGEGDGTLYTMEDKALLHDVRVSFPRGQLTVVVGATGSGKSVLLATLLGAFRFEGRVRVAPSVAYVPQQPWIMQDTVEANITFFEGGRRRVAAGGGDGDGDSGVLGGSACALSPLRCADAPAARGSATRRGDGGGAGGAAALGERLARAVESCQLAADLALMTRGLQTEIGERGINLSGGQKARVSLARAVYADRDVYVLDDPLSALDAHVGRRVMDEVVLRALAGKTRVLVTHQLQVLPHADQVVVVREGRAVYAGSYADYAASEWRAYVEHEEEEAAAHKKGAAAAAGTADTADVAGERNEFSPAASPVTAAEPPGADCAADADGGADAVSAKLSRQSTRHAEDAHTADGDVDEEEAALMTTEEKETGHIPWAVYRTYFEAGGGVRLAVQIIFQHFVCEAVGTAVNVWLTLWSVNYFAASLSSSQHLGIYIVLVVAVALVLPANEFLIYTFARRAARRLHATLLYTVSSATLTFFDRTPLGRIVNRLSKDVYVLDDELPSCIIPLLGISAYAATSLAVTLFASPYTIIVMVCAAYLFSRLLEFYATVVREVRRRGSVVQSPLFSLLAEVAHGRATIAAYDKSHAVFAEALRRLDLVYSCTYVEKTVTLWLAIRIEYVAALVIIAVGLIGVVEKLVDASPEMSETRVGLISLSLTMCLDLSWALSAILDFAAVVEASMNSVQRVCHYIDEVPQEALLMEPRDPYVAGALGARTSGGGGGVEVVVDGEAPRAVAGDREFGALVLEHVDMRYRAGLPLVLRDVCFAVAPGQKVGVVGRTGSGKSTLLLALLRLVEVCGGRIRVCGRDARTYSLPALRRLFSMIPQDPVLFDGTIRSNVDPFGDASDAEVRAALASVGFVDAGRESPVSAASPTAGGVPGLETVVQEGGSNFSVGQRQLLCLARALLKKGSAFILMDEATANVDARLDQTVQRVVAEQFRAYTVVTIAHRLHTVAAYDVVLVMAHGRVVEMGSPRSLLERRGSVFRGMVAQSAVVTAAAAAAAGAGAAGAPREDAGANDESGAELSAELSAEERERRVEAVVASFLQQCK